MSVVHPHPEELFDREVAGALTESERVRLENHLACCAPCRLERLARADFRDEFASEARRAKLAATVSLILETSVPRVRPARTSKWRVRGALFVSALVVASGAAASQWNHVWRPLTPAMLMAKTKPAVDPTRSASDPQPTGVVAGLGPSAAAIAEPGPRGSQALAGRSAATVALPAKSVRPAPTVVASPRREAAVLFDQANDARSRGDYDVALALYREVVDRFSAAPEAEVTEAILARLLLDRGDPAEALRRFEGHLARGTASLREESLVGRAQALERLGRGKEERAAWSALLSEFPRCNHAPEARARLAAPGEP